MTHSEHQAIEALALQALRTLESADVQPPRDAQASDQDYYTLLGVPPESDDATIQNALDIMMAQEPPIAVRTALHNAAAVLLNPDLRTRYNAIP